MSVSAFNYWLSIPKRQLKSCIKSGLRLAKSGYKLLPLSIETKLRHRQYIEKKIPRLLTLASSKNQRAFKLTSSPWFEELKAKKGLCKPLALEELNTLVIPCAIQPVVSVIIPVYGKIAFTLQCLQSIALYPPKTAFEVIVIDDCSPDDSLSYLEKIQGINLIKNAVNQGFIKSCNKAAKEAKGRYLYFLNNDTEVTPNWLDNLLRTFEELPGTGLVGSKLIYPDGSLQEAGGIVCADSSIINYGRNQNPDLPEYCYAREVDYCSGASIMVPKDLFNEIGMFDEHYQPAYCEDTDLAIHIRSKGYRVIYQPLSVVVHHEGISSGTDLKQGVKKYQVGNTKKLFARWEPVLKHYATNSRDIENAKDRRAKYRLLVIDLCSPTPDKDAGSVVAFNTMLLFREMGFQVTFIPEDNFMYLPDYTSALQRAGIEALYHPFDKSVSSHVKRLGSRYDLVLLIRPDVAYRYTRMIRKHCSKAKILYLPADLHFLRMTREAALAKNTISQSLIEKTKEKELYSFAAADGSLVHSTVEQDLIRNLLPNAKVHLLPLIMDIKTKINPLDGRKDIVFVGGYQHTPNVDAVIYFVNNLMPLLRKQLPGVRFHIVGSNMPQELQAMACEDIVIVGYIDDLTDYLNGMRVMVAPLRYGAGAKGKVASSMAAGLPVVASPIAVEGMAIQNGQDVLVAKNEDEFVMAITKLYSDSKLWEQLSKNGLLVAEKNWGKQAVWDKLAWITNELGMEVTKSNYPLSVI